MTPAITKCGPGEIKLTSGGFPCSAIKKCGPGEVNMTNGGCSPSTSHGEDRAEDQEEQQCHQVDRPSNGECRVEDHEELQYLQLVRWE